MSAEIKPLERAFRAIGSQIVVNSGQRRTRITVEGRRVDEHFVLDLAEGARPQALEVVPGDRHLVLLVAERDGSQGTKARFLCGFDERHRFVAAIPEATPVSTVRAAKEALAPPEIRELPVRRRRRGSRNTGLYRRQGEWFFLPAPGLAIGAAPILGNEPIRRGRGKPHMCEELVRTGGETVYVNGRHPGGLTEREHSLLSDEQRRDEPPFRVMRRDPIVHVRGRVSHPDHATINLNGWHRVLLNTESGASASTHVAFLD